MFLEFLRLWGLYASEAWAQRSLMRRNMPLTVADVQRLCVLAWLYPSFLAQGSVESGKRWERTTEHPIVEHWSLSREADVAEAPTTLASEDRDVLIELKCSEVSFGVFMRWPGGSAEISWPMGSRICTNQILPMSDETWEYFGPGFGSKYRSDFRRSQRIFVEALSLVLPDFVLHNLHKSKSPREHSTLDLLPPTA